MISRILAKSKLKLVAGQPVPIEQIDAVLDVPTDRFERTAEQIAVQLRRADADIDVVGYRARRTISVHGDAQPSMPDVRGVGFYQMDLRRLPPMDREEEFRMARRYEFFKLREPRRYAVLESFPTEEMEHAHMNSAWLAAIGPKIVECIDGTWEREYLDPFKA